MKVQLYVGDALKAYAFGDGHPFGPDRLDAFWDEACARELDAWVQICEPRAADRAQIERFHTAAYVDRVRRLSEVGGGFLDLGDTPAFRGMYEAAAVVVGTTLAACDAIMGGSATRAFIPVAGLHHARRDAAAGFCVFNDVGVAIETLKASYGLTRIAYVDMDAHHGDGVFYGFEDDPAVIVVDLHEDGRYLYPGTGQAHETGRGAAEGLKLNLPLAPGADDRQFHDAWQRAEAFVDAAQPQIIVFQCGADSVAGDPITHLQLSPKAHGGAARALCRLAERHCRGRLLALGGGGYDRHNLARAWCEVLAGLIGL